MSAGAWITLTLACCIAGYALGHRDGRDMMAGKRRQWWQ